MPRQPLDLPARRRLFHEIQRQPGLHQRELGRVTGLATGTLEHHLRVLEKQGLVASREEANRVRYFTTDVSRQDKDLLRVLRPRPSRRVILALLEEPDLSLSEVAERIGLAVSSTHTHVKRLVESGVLVKERVGGSVALRVADEDACISALVTHRPSFTDRAVDRFLEAFGTLDPAAVRKE